jgi:hypothetical protein
MNTASNHRLPGVYFQAAPPLLQERLPRMDIAAFIGLATSGPLHTPVPVEDVARFRDIFGADLQLAWDATSGQMQYANLAPAVEAFFRNGGLRCWVVRVAGEARTNRFSLPSLVRADNGQPALVRARCAGSWSDRFRVGTVLQSQALNVRFQLDTDTYRVEVVSAPRQIQPGDLLQLTFGDTGPLLFLAVEVVEAMLPGPHVQGISHWFLRQDALRTPLDASRGLELVAAWQAAGSPPEALQPIAELLTFDLIVWSEDKILARLGQLAFSANHPRFWGRLPVDEEVFRLPEQQPVQRMPGPLEQEASEPPFPLAGPEMPAPLYLPLGMPTTPDLTTAQDALDTADLTTRLERDGLKRFSADFFLDSDLARVGSDALLAEAHHKYSLQRKLLRGLHSLLPLDEVTLVAIPDAVQPGWQEDTTPIPDLLQAPVLAPVPHPDDQGEAVLSWSAVAQDASYTLQEASDPAFANPVTRDTGTETAARVSGKDCPQRYYYRVRAWRGGEISPWSNTESAVMPQPDFADCQIVVLEAPTLQLLALGSPPEGDYCLCWSVVDGATEYLLQEAAEPAFATATIIYTGSETAFQVGRQSQRVYYYRVQARHAQEYSPWSNTQFFALLPRQGWVMQPPVDYNNGDLLAVQRALLRFCTARGDLLAVLTLPQYYREAEVLSHVATLSPHAANGAAQATGSGQVRVLPLTLGEARALSYGALYHPWIVARVERRLSPLDSLPPDGVVCGTMAAGAIGRGAWVAPANVPLKGVVSLTPAVTRQGWAVLFEAQVNVLRQDPRGFLLLSAETLSTETALRLINVRRLLILLRRLAWREGLTYVFEPNDASFRRLVQRRFEQWLADLYSRGAFVGDTPGSAYQVVVDNSINPPASLEQGRVIVELRVAPSRPMAFLIVRLVQMGQEALVIQEV